MEKSAIWEDLKEQIFARQRLELNKALALFDLAHFHEAGRLANAERERRHGNKAFYILNRHINYSNVCKYQCRLCAFSAREGEAKAWALSLEQIFEIAREELGGRGSGGEERGAGGSANEVDNVDGVDGVDRVEEARACPPSPQCPPGPLQPAPPHPPTQNQAAGAKPPKPRANSYELHIVGGAHPAYGLEFYERMLRGLKEIAPGVHIKAFSAVEIHHIAERAGLPIRETLERLRAAGLDSLPGGGAEIFAERVRREICPDKPNADQWLDVHRQAHLLGMRTNATILYGHIETPAERVDHLLQLRALQDETGGFQAIIPLKFHPENTRLAHLPLSGGLLDLQMIAACRLILDNFDHVKAYWPSLGLKTAQIALAWGADDLDGTVVQERIYQTAGGKAPKGLDEESLRALIIETGRAPIRRDSYYREI
ncbi:MAG: CofH family radical SAM protein [Candidatus Sumerlaeota bacterium]|nr:CofH family radical SAM protein [Candidatus Sumerlaeota bacterium]